ncbi:MAG: CopG family transcriptional regulator [Methanomicrobiales archaeon]|nr:CopG family transcriptional regulator [Methanomicrobiales archaeon]
MMRITTSLDRETLERIDREAESKGISRSQMVAAAIEQYLASAGSATKHRSATIEHMEMHIRILQDQIAWLEGEIREAHREKELILQKIPPYTPGTW